MRGRCAEQQHHFVHASDLGARRIARFSPCVGLALDQNGRVFAPKVEIMGLGGLEHVTIKDRLVLPTMNLAAVDDLTDVDPVLSRITPHRPMPRRRCSKSQSEALRHLDAAPPSKAACE
jgi:hypothetical protein